MIIDNIRNRKSYYKLSQRLAIALEWLHKSRSHNLKSGSTYDIRGKEIYALIFSYETKSLDKGIWEAHRKYIDVHSMITGVEKIGYANLNALRIIKPYNKSTDGLQLAGKGDFITLRKGQFAIFSPQDAHMTGIAVIKPQRVKKIVIKVSTNQK